MKRKLNLERQQQILDRIALIKRLNAGAAHRQQEAYQEYLRSAAGALANRLEPMGLSGAATERVKKKVKKLGRMMGRVMKR
jgi:hypothetical protein